VKRSIQAVLALFVVVACFGLAGAPSGAVPPTAPAAKVFTITSAPATSVWSQSVKLTVTLTPRGGGQPKGGTVTFLVDGIPLGTAPATTRNTTLTTREIPPGDHTLTAQYSGDAVIAPGTTAIGSPITVAAAPATISLRATVDPVPDEERAEIKATVLAASPAVTTRRPTGSVTFSVDGCLSATVALNSNGVATWRPWLCPGERTITATYDGSDRHAPSGPSAPLTITVLGPEDPDGEDLDQVNGGDPNGFLLISDDGETSSAYAQTFVPGRTGRLYAVDLLGFWFSEDDTPPPALQVTIQALDESGLPTGTVLGSGAVPPGDLGTGGGGPIHLDLDTVADVEQGVAYAIVLEVTPQTPEAYGTWILAATVGDDAYVPGELFEQIDGSGWISYTGDPTADLLFRTHVGDPV
jgi:hypothetical protein